MKRCLFCYDEISSDEEFHTGCSKKFFGSDAPPDFDHNIDELKELAKKIVQSQIAVTGVQAKLSLNIDKKKSSPSKFTVVGLWGGYILKLPSPTYQQLPELEDVTMHLAKMSSIDTVPHSLFRLKSGELVYLAKRVDRTRDGKLHMEDMCQLTERLTEHKYRGSYEQIAKAIMKYSAHPGLDVVNFYEQVVFSFLTGNADMHLKNFSLLQGLNGYTLSPAYDMWATSLVVRSDDEDLALTLNGKKRKIKKEDFVAAMKQVNVDTKVTENIFKKFQITIPKWRGFFKKSFLTDEMKHRYVELIHERASRLQLNIGQIKNLT